MQRVETLHRSLAKDADRVDHTILLQVRGEQRHAAQVAASAMHARAQAVQLRELEGEAMLLCARADEVLGQAQAAARRAQALALAERPLLPARQPRCQPAHAVDGARR